MIEVNLYKFVRTQAFGEYINGCADSLNPAATTNAIELISLDYPELNIKKAMYRYDEGAREKAGWLQVEATLKVLELPFLEQLKGVDHILSVDKVLRIDVDEDRIFRQLDKARVVCPLGPPISSPNP